MTSSKRSDDAPPSPRIPQSYYQQLPSDPHQQPQQPQYIILLPRYYNNRRPRLHLSRTWRRCLICLLTLVLLGLAVFLLWPSDPEVSIVRLRLDHLRIHLFPIPSLDITLDVTVKIQNRDFFSIDYKSLIVAIGYRGKQLGYATSDHGHIKARGSSFVNATVHLSGVNILSDMLLLIEDLATGEITFDTDTKIGGQLGLAFFEIPLQGKVSCEIIVNIHNQTIEHQNCYPE